MLIHSKTIKLQPKSLIKLHRKPLLTLRRPRLNPKLHKHRQALKHPPLPLLPLTAKNNKSLAITSIDSFVYKQIILC